MIIFRAVIQSKISKVKTLLTVVKQYSYLVTLAVTIKYRLNFHDSCGEFRESVNSYQKSAWFISNLIVYYFDLPIILPAA